MIEVDKAKAQELFDNGITVTVCYHDLVLNCVSWWWEADNTDDVSIFEFNVDITSYPREGERISFSVSQIEYNNHIV